MFCVCALVCRHRRSQSSPRILTLPLGRMETGCRIYVVSIKKQTDTHLIVAYQEDIKTTHIYIYTHIIPLSHYSKNAPRIHNVGHIFQIAKVPSGVFKIRPAFLLDSATFLAIANACGNVQGGTCVSGRHFIFSKIREFVKNPIQQTYESMNTIR